MQETIKEIVEIVKDYRVAEKHTVNEERVKRWIEQFEKDDREFVLSEFLNILKKRYLSEKNAKRGVKDIIKGLSKELGYKNEVDFLENSFFLKLQMPGKSQTTLLEFFKELILQEYGLKFEQCGSKGRNNYIYIDDILCTGNTVYFDIINWVTKKVKQGKTNMQILNQLGSKIILMYFIIHSYNQRKLRSRFWRYGQENPEYKNLVDICATYFFASLEVDNDIENPNSRLDFVYPLRNTYSKKAIKYGKTVIENVNNDCIKKRIPERPNHFVREKGTPKKESLFTSPSNRVRFENILLEKGIEILDHVNVHNKNIRPLGYSLPTYKNFGFGTLSFTWRNVPNNVPIVFWYNAPDYWFPLFENKR